MLLRSARLVALVMVTGCSFNTGGVGTADGSPPLTDGPMADARYCPEDIHIEVQLNGIAVTEGQITPVVRGLVGDTISLTSNGTCVRLGPASYNWFVSPGVTNDTMWPSHVASEVLFYTRDDIDFQVTLIVGDANLDTRPFTFTAVSSAGFTELDGPVGPAATINDLAVGQGFLWLATAGGSFKIDLSDTTRMVDVAAMAANPPPADTVAVWFEAASNDVWFAGAGVQSDVWRMPAGGADFSLIDAAGILGGTANVFDIGEALGKVWIGTSRGAASVPSQGSAFDVVLVPDADTPVDSVAGDATRAFGGGHDLFDLTDASVAVQPFAAGPDQQIHAVYLDSVRNQLWVASDKGIALMNATNSPPTRIAEWNQAHGTSFGKVFDIAMEADGELWFATDKGVVRYKREWNGPVFFDQSLGVVPAARIKWKAVAVDVGNGRRVVYGGSDAGLVHAVDPTPTQ